MISRATSVYYLMRHLGLLTFGLSLATAVLADTPVVFPDSRKFAESGGRDFLIPSAIPGDFKTPEGVVTAMFLLGDQVKDSRLSAPFSPATLKNTSHFVGARPLGAYLRGARIDGTTFVLAFDGEAMRYLNNTAAIQEVVKGAIEATIRKNFPDIKSIAYEVDGKLISDWDA